MNADKNIVKWIWFSLATAPGSPYAAKILAADDEIDELYEREYKVEDYNGVPEYVIKALNTKSLSYARSIYEYCDEHDILPVHIFDKRFPPKLRYLQDHPVLLYYKGIIPQFKDHVMIAVVGTRKCTEYGLNITYEICDNLARARAIVVSGMAKGIDGAASTAALNANGFTVAVLGCGVDVIYPKENEALYNQIRRNGLLVSEYPPLFPGSRKTFPERNRLISGMCDGTLVVEADSESGALITANCAIYQGRDIFAVPGNIDSPASAGTNELIKNGAEMVTVANDIICKYQFSAKVSLIPMGKRHFDKIKEERKKRKSAKNVQGNDNPSRKPKDKGDKPGVGKLLSNDEKLVFNALGSEAMSCDEISAVCGLPTSKTSAMLTMLTIKGVVKSMPGNRYTRN